MKKCFLKIQDCKEGIVKYPEYVETANLFREKGRNNAEDRRKERLCPYEVYEDNKGNVFQDKKEH